MPRRKPGTLLPLETEILATAVALGRAGQPTFHGFALAQSLREQGGGRALTAHGTLYKALGRLEEMGLLTSSWEEGEVEGRPRRRLYELTGKGARVAWQIPAGGAESGAVPRRVGQCERGADARAEDHEDEGGDVAAEHPWSVPAARAAQHASFAASPADRDPTGRGAWGRARPRMQAPPHRRGSPSGASS
jgi:PadR family transcriptional regulator, regulatory protein PadR